MQLIFEGAGSVDVLVFSNALGTTSAMWDAQVAEFKQRFQLVRYDHPPLNRVDALADALLEALTHAGVESFSFCGLSLGGMVGMDLAARHPARIASLVLACTSARFGDPDEWTAQARRVREQGMESVAHEALDKWLSSRHPDRERFLSMQLETSADDYACGLEAIGSFDFRDRLPEITAPTLVIAGADDVATTPNDGKLVADGVRDGRLVVIPGAAHLANVEKSDDFNVSLKEHLEH
jgi:3-oxoadipate enol-lactonase